jgi:glyoxylase-like metal-dependent hydrolase (beta-lactamase superfamily II)
VLETHIHNDYVTGGYALARATGAAYLVNAADPVSFDRVPVEDRQVVAVGDRMRLTAVATPGHTWTHLSYLLTDGADADGRALAVLSGGSLLHGSTGRPDLLGPDHTDALVRRQHASARLLADLAPGSARLLPTHGFGSFCSATQSDVTASTIGDERLANPVLREDVETWVAGLLAGLDAWPAYYARMAPANLAGPDAPDLTPPRHADADQILRALHAGEWVVDLRHRTAFAAGHVPGSLSFGLEDSFVTYLGWLLPAGTPLTLLGETPEQVALAQRELSRIGLDRPVAQATGGPEDWTTQPSSFPVARFADLESVRRHRDVVVLDVRLAGEHAERRLDGAVGIPLHELPGRLGEVPDGEVWVHCGAGYRAAVAGSLLAARGRSVVVVDDEFDRAADAGLPLVEASA